MADARIPFAFDPRYRIAARAFGVSPDRAYLELDDDRLVARFGPWLVETPRANIEGAGVSGPYSIVKTIGPAHLSFADHGLTFATNDRAGVCIRFKEPVTGIDPVGAIRHRGLTVTVADPEALVAELTEGEPVLRTDVARKEQEQAAVDDLHTMTARELRQLADELGLAHTSSMKKAQLVALIESRVGDDLVEVVEAFLAALMASDLDAALDLVDEDLVYVNVGLPTIRGRAGLAKAFAAMDRPTVGFEAYLHAITADGPVVLTERTDVLILRGFRAQFWVCGRFDVHDGKITLWRDAFDFVDVMRGNLRGLAAMVLPSLAPKAPTGRDDAPGRGRLFR